MEKIPQKKNGRLSGINRMMDCCKSVNERAKTGGINAFGLIDRLAKWA